MTIATSPTAIPDLLGTSPADLAVLDANAPIATLEQARGRAERIRAGLESYTRMRQDIADAYAGRDWKALGYPSWFAYLEGEYGDELKRLTRDERPQAINDLHRQGLSTRQIADRTDIPRETVRRTVTGDPNGSPKRPQSPGSSAAAIKPSVDPGKPVTPEPGAASSTAPSGPGPAGVASTREGDATPAPEWWRWTCFGCRTPFEGTDNACPACGGVGTNRKPIDPEPTAPSREDQVEVGRRSAETLVATMRVEVAIIITAVDLGEYLVTEQMIADLRIAVDLLESRLGGCE